MTMLPWRMGDRDFATMRDEELLDIIAHVAGAERAAYPRPH
jgi:hypothetical protein